MCERKIISNPHVIGKGQAALYDYHQPLIKKGIWKLKYRHQRAMGQYFGIALYREFFKDMKAQATHLREPIILIPIPLSKRKFRTRGFNHAEIIARAIAERALADKLPITIDTQILVKTKETKRQVETVGKHERKDNLHGAFAVTHEDRIAGKTIVLIDDVITTGSTMSEARKTISQYKPKRVLCIAVAH